MEMKIMKYRIKLVEFHSTPDTVEQRDVVVTEVSDLATIMVNNGKAMRVRLLDLATARHIRRIDQKAKEDPYYYAVITHERMSSRRPRNYDGWVEFDTLHSDSLPRLLS
jgi:hypothetical protein